MVVYKCIKVFKDNDKIIGYRLEQVLNPQKVIDIDKDRLKVLIKRNIVDVANLTLTSDNRLIMSKNNIASNNQRSLLLDSTLLELISKSVRPGLNWIFKVVDNATISKIKVSNLYTQQIQGTLYEDTSKKIPVYLAIKGDQLLIMAKVDKIYISDSRLINYLYSICNANKIDFKEVDMSKLNSKVKDMSYMFEDCELNEINLKDISIDKIKDMRSMFNGCKTDNIDLSNFNINGEKDMSHLFEGCDTDNIGFKPFAAGKSTDLSHWFEGCEPKAPSSTPVSPSNTSTITNILSKCKDNTIKSFKKVLDKADKKTKK